MISCGCLFLLRAQGRDGQVERRDCLLLHLGRHESAGIRLVLRPDPQHSLVAPRHDAVPALPEETRRAVPAGFDHQTHGVEPSGNVDQSLDNYRHVDRRDQRYRGVCCVLCQTPNLA